MQASLPCFLLAEPSHPQLSSKERGWESFDYRVWHRKNWHVKRCVFSLFVCHWWAQPGPTGKKTPKLYLILLHGLILVGMLAQKSVQLTLFWPAILKKSTIHSWHWLECIEWELHAPHNKQSATTLDLRLPHDTMTPWGSHTRLTPPPIRDWKYPARSRGRGCILCCCHISDLQIFEYLHTFIKKNAQALRDETPVATGGTLFSVGCSDEHGLKFEVQTGPNPWHFLIKWLQLTGYICTFVPRFFLPQRWHSLVKLPGLQLQRCLWLQVPDPYCREGQCGNAADAYTFVARLVKYDSPLHTLDIFSWFPDRMIFRIFT